MQEALNTFLSVFATALAAAVAGFVVQFIREEIATLRQTRLNGAIGRAAGQVLQTLADNPMVADATQQLIYGGVTYVRASFPQLIKKVGSPSDEHLAEMIRGEVGRLQAGAATTSSGPHQ